MARGRRRVGSSDPCSQKRSSNWMRAEARRILKTRIVGKTKDKSATLWYDLAFYHQHVFLRRRIRLVRWPAGVPFRNLSRLTQSQLTVLLTALQKRGRAAVRFVDVSEAEAAARVHDVEGVAPGAFEEADINLGNPGRGDVKKSRFKDGKPVSTKRKLRVKGAITQKWIEDADWED